MVFAGTKSASKFHLDVLQQLAGTVLCICRKLVLWHGEVSGFKFRVKGSASRQRLGGDSELRGSVWTRSYAQRTRSYANGSRHRRACPNRYLIDIREFHLRPHQKRNGLNGGTQFVLANRLDNGTVLDRAQYRRYSSVPYVLADIDQYAHGRV